MISTQRKPSVRSETTAPSDAQSSRRGPQALPVLASFGARLQAFLGRGRRDPLTPAQRLQTGLRPLHIKPDDGLRTMLRLRKRDLQTSIAALGRPGLTGRWRKDSDASDSMHDAIEAVNLAWFLRPALAVLKTLEVEDTSSHFSTNLKAGGLMDVVERYPWTGQSVAHSRRDKRGGKHLGSVTRCDDGSATITCTWGDPYGGRCADTFSLTEDGHTLVQTTEMVVTGGHPQPKNVRYRTVYRRIRQQ